MLPQALELLISISSRSLSRSNLPESSWIVRGREMGTSVGEDEGKTLLEFLKLEMPRARRQTRKTRLKAIKIT